MMINNLHFIHKKNEGKKLNERLKLLFVGTLIEECIKTHQTYHVSELLNFFVTTLPKLIPSLSTILWAKSGCEVPLNTFILGILGFKDSDFSEISKHSNFLVFLKRARVIPHRQFAGCLEDEPLITAENQSEQLKLNGRFKWFKCYPFLNDK